MAFKIHIKNQLYTEWIIYDTKNMHIVENISVDPLKFKLFSNDSFNIDENGENFQLIHSCVRRTQVIPGVLCLQNNQTFGKINNKFLFKCVPDDKHLPIFLIPYDPKKDTCQFNKNFINKYIIFKLTSWEDKHPIGSIQNIIGVVSNLSFFYEYQLFCKSLYASIQDFSSNAVRKIMENDKSGYPTFERVIQKNNIQNHLHKKIFTIDSSTTTDYDDALCIETISSNEYRISIYIANVPLVIDELNLWKSFTERISTIYLPDRKRPMLPTILSDTLCSLREINQCKEVGQSKKLTFGMSFHVQNDTIITESISFFNAYIEIYKNHIYESDELLKDENYLLLYDVLQVLSKKVKFGSRVNNSYDVVSYLMILMNYYTACEMIKDGNGIYRCIRESGSMPDTPLPENNEDIKELQTFLKIWNSAAGQYRVFNEKEEHAFLELESYIHVTSPIRRLVDLLNMLQFQINKKMVTYSDDAKDFYKHWIERMDYINMTMRTIRKLQSDCVMLDLCKNDESILENTHIGFLFDKIMRDDGLYQYVVYLPKIKLVSRITTRFNYDNYSKANLKIYLFDDQSCIKRKIRLQII